MSKELLRDAVSVMETWWAKFPTDMSASDRAVVARMQAEIDASEKEPFGWYSAKNDEFILHLRKTEHERLGSYTSKVGGFNSPLYTKSQPTADDDFKPDLVGYRQGVEDGKAGAELGPVADLTDAEIVEIAIASRGAEPGRDGYILPISFARAVLAAQKGKV